MKKSEGPSQEELGEEGMIRVWAEIDQLLTNPNFHTKERWVGNAFVVFVAPRNPIYRATELQKTMEGLFTEKPTWVKRFWETTGDVMHFGALGFCAEGAYHEIGTMTQTQKDGHFPLSRLFYRINMYPDVLIMERGYKFDIAWAPIEKLRSKSRLMPLALSATKEQIATIGYRTRMAGHHVVERAEAMQARTRSLTQRAIVAVSERISFIHF